MTGQPLRIEYGQRPKVLLLGNGVNRAFSFADSWDALLQTIQTRSLTEEEEKSLEKVPYPLRPVILTGNRLETDLPQIAKKLTELQAGEPEEELLRVFADLPVDTILTTNYTYELEKALIPDFKCTFGCRCKHRKVACASSGGETPRWLNTYFETPDKTPPIWHIHGEAARPDTMILGHYYYGKLLSRIQQYIPRLLARYKGNHARGQGMAVHSWIDYFLLGDVYTVGFGLDLSELDLWWLINCKKRNFGHTKVVFHKPDISTAQRLLAEAYGMEVVTGGLVDGDYKTYYRQLQPQLAALLTRTPSHR